MDLHEVASGINIDDIMAKATVSAEKKSKLAPVFLERESFAKNAISTSSLWLDNITGGGVPPSRTLGISGPERSGKSLLVTEIIRNQSEHNRYTAYFDAEGDSDPFFLKNRGIDFQKYRGARTPKGNLKKGEKDYLHYYQPSTGEDVLNYIHEIAKQLPENRNAAIPPMIFILDSVVALIPDDILEDPSKNAMAYHARMYSKLMPIVNSGITRTGCSFIYTNQLRQKPGVMYGPSTYEPCGDALKFFSSMRLSLSQAKPKLLEKDHPFTDGFAPGGTWKANGVWEEPHVREDGSVGLGKDKYIYTAVRTNKNKLFTPYQVCWIRIQFEENGSMGKGLDPVFDIFSFLGENGYIEPASLTPEEKEAKVKVAEIKNQWQITPGTNYDLRQLELPERFDYQILKSWIKSRPNIVRELREEMIVSGLVYKKD